MRVRELTLFEAKTDAATADPNSNIRPRNAPRVCVDVFVCMCACHSYNGDYYRLRFPACFMGNARRGKCHNFTLALMYATHAEGTTYTFTTEVENGKVGKAQQSTVVREKIISPPGMGRIHLREDMCVSAWDRC